MGTGGGFVKGRLFLSLGQFMQDKTAVDIAEGVIIAKDAARKWEIATAAGGTHINQFSVCPDPRLAANGKVSVLNPGSIISVQIPAGQTGTPQKEAVLSATAGQAQDRNAEAANKVCGVFLGTPAMLDGETALAAVAGPAAIYMRIAEWRYV